MAGLFDRLKEELGDDDENVGGITPLEIANLPEVERKLMQWMLRFRKASSEGVTAKSIAENYDDTPPNLSEVLHDLTRNGWLIDMGESPNVRYRINLRRKRGSTLGFGLWTILGDRLAGEDTSFND